MFRRWRSNGYRCDGRFEGYPSAEVKSRPPFLRALGDADPPSQVEIDGIRYWLREIFKHDSWAATAVYASAQDRVVCKFNRQQSLFGLPMKWLGRGLARREAHVLQSLAEVAGIPEHRGPVACNGKPLRHAVAHRYIEGHPLGHAEHVDDAFFPALRRILDQMHGRGLVYVDLHKRENVVVGDDGRPYLIDFQVSYIRPRRRWLAALLRRFEQALRQTDLYHLKKHVANSRPDLAGDVRVAPDERPWLIRAHRRVAVPLRGLRRRILVLLGVREGKGLAESERFPEYGKRAGPARAWRSPASCPQSPCL